MERGRQETETERHPRDLYRKDGRQAERHLCRRETWGDGGGERLRSEEEG